MVVARMLVPYSLAQFCQCCLLSCISCWIPKRRLPHLLPFGTVLIDLEATVKHQPLELVTDLEVSRDFSLERHSCRDSQPAHHCIVFTATAFDLVKTIIE